MFVFVEETMNGYHFVVLTTFACDMKTHQFNSKNYWRFQIRVSIFQQN